jgi:hypothetical protein
VWGGINWLEIKLMESILNMIMSIWVPLKVGGEGGY